MKKDFFDIMYKLMQENKNVTLLFCGLGYPRYDEFKKKFKDRAINTEASEQTALDIAVGLAYEGKIPFVYTITPFLLRGFETIRTYINRENLHVVLIGAGRDEEYSKHDGYSHDERDIKEILGTQKNIVQYYPDNIDHLQHDIIEAIGNKKPNFINIHK